jgi:chromosome segregation ATPase
MAMEITIDTVISLLGLFIGGGGGAFFTWRYMRRKAKAEAQTEEVNMAKAVQDAYQQMLQDKETDLEDRKKVIAELREERDHYKNDRNELRDRVGKMEDTVLELKREVARNGRMVESMRPFLCYDMKCKKRVRVQVSECEAAEIEPINHEGL